MKPLTCEPIPMRMRTLERDRRGYPIPCIVMRDKEGRPHFTINDSGKVAEVRRKRLCGICGKRLEGEAWFVGGPRCFTEEHGAFIDPHMHRECASYALRVCPYLAAPSYAKRVDDRTLRPDARPDDVAIVAVEGMPDRRPPVFVLGGTRLWLSFSVPTQGDLYRAERWFHYEVWHHGKRLAEASNEDGWQQGEFPLHGTVAENL